MSAFVLFHLLAIIWTWPLAAHLSSRIPHDQGDPILVTWILWWNARTLPFTPGWWDPPFLFPLRGALALSEHFAGITPITTPIQLAGGSPLVAYNVAVILSYSLSAFFAYLLARRVTGSIVAAICCGMAYGFAPYRAGQLAHLQVLWTQWLPLAVLALHAHIETGRVGWLALFALAWLVQTLSNGYFLLFFPVLLVMWLAWFVDWRSGAGRAGAILCAWIVASLPLLPVLWKYQSVQSALGLSRTLSEMEHFSARPSSLLRPPPMLAIWPTLPARSQEDYLFPGATVVAVVVIAALASVRRPAALGNAIARRSALLFYSIAAIVMYVLSFGPAPPNSGFETLLHPYTLLMQLPGFTGLRAPARFAMLGTFCLSVAAAIAIAQIRGGARRARVILSAIVLAGLFVDTWMEPMPLAAPPGRLVLPDVPGAAVLELPADAATVSTAAMYRAIFHQRPLINGYTGYTPPHYAILTLGLRRGDPTTALELARGRPLIIVVSDRYDPGGDFRRYVESLSGVQRRSAGSGGGIYVVPAQPAARSAPAGRPLRTTAKEIAPEHLELDLGAPRTVRTIEFPLRWHYGELGERLAVAVSQDRVQWTSAWEDWTGGLALAAALDDPLVVPMRLMLRDVSARYIRIHPAPRWMQREIRVNGP